MLPPLDDLIGAGGGSQLPIAPSDYKQLISGDFRTIGTFDGSSYLMVPKPQTITSEWQKFFSGSFIPSEPTQTVEGVWRLSNGFGLYISSNPPNQTVNAAGNGVPDYNIGVLPTIKSPFSVEVYLKDDSIRTVFTSSSGVSDLTVPASWNNLVSTNFEVGRWFTNTLSGHAFNFSDDEEFWALNGSLTGTLGTEAILTGSTESELFATEYCADGSPNMNYALREATPEVVPVAGADRPIGNFDDDGTLALRDQVIAGVPIQSGGPVWELSFKIQHKNPGGNPFGGIVTCRAATNAERVFWIEKDFVSTNAQIFFYNESYNIEERLELPILDGAFHDCRIEVEPMAFARVYVDGVEVAFAALNAPLASDAVVTSIGAQVVSRTIDAYLWDVEYKVAGQSVWKYNMDDGSGSIIRDTSGNDNHGVLQDSTPGTFWDNGIVNKINLNPAANLDLPFADVYQTKEQIAALHNSVSIFTSENKPGIFRAAVPEVPGPNPAAELFVGRIPTVIPFLPPPPFDPGDFPLP